MDFTPPEFYDAPLVTYCDICPSLFKYDNKVKPYKVVNFFAILGHLINVVLTFTLSSESGQNLNFNVRRTYVGWEKLNSTNITCSDTSYVVQDFVVTPASTQKGFELNLFALIVAFHLLSFFFQLASYAPAFNYDENISERGVNPLRFIEYSISASIMLVCIALVSNILLLPSIVALFFMSFATNIFGGIAELLFDDKLLETKNMQFNDDTDVGAMLRTIGWVAHFTGWITLIAAYGTMIFDDFQLSVHESGVELPWFVPFIVWGIFFFYSFFGLIQLFQLCMKDCCMRSCCREKSDKGTQKCKRFNECFVNYPKTLGRAFCCCFGDGCGRDGPDMNVNEFVELVYVFNSLTTKTILGWVIISNLLSEEQRLDGDRPSLCA